MKKFIVVSGALMLAFASSVAMANETMTPAHPFYMKVATEHEKVCGSAYQELENKVYAGEGYFFGMNLILSGGGDRKGRLTCVTRAMGWDADHIQMSHAYDSTETGQMTFVDVKIKD